MLTHEDLPIAPSNQTPFVSRWVNPRFLMPLLYVVSGCLVIFSLILMFNTHVLHLKVETAVVSTFIETLVAPVGGYITDVFVTPGEQVKKGTPLLKIENFELEQKLQLTRVQVEESQLMTHYYQQLLKNEHQRLHVYQKIGLARALSAQAFVNISQQDVLKTKHNLNRFTLLHKKNYVSQAHLEEAQAKHINAKEQLNHAIAQQNIETHALNAVHQGMYFTGTKTEGIARDLAAELEIAQNKQLLNEARVLIYENLIKKLTLIAPFDGRVTQILKSAGSTTNNIKPILFIENTGLNKTIVAYLTQNEILQVGASMNVNIYLPSSGNTYHGTIIEINRTDGFVDEIRAQYQWRDFQMDRSARVVLAIRQDDQQSFDHLATAGMPAVVYFTRNRPKLPWHR
jgi:multidrug resistance efflux pump